ncbi:unnamed protein product [Zymoseptoria tritici ST99CH_1E4]|uniref:non-specific serine/threonine protein kinase n=1 Tax=Zymoseptoria tritici ST99CH_1E4 TaxID=1276532 RepID=A0A2H1FIY7_ZYMTR|nr:unnamed protein product [Zymoseptoria tritici ST99CH_1E4]
MAGKRLRGASDDPDAPLKAQRKRNREDKAAAKARLANAANQNNESAEQSARSQAGQPVLDAVDQPSESGAAQAESVAPPPARTGGFTAINATGGGPQMFHFQGNLNRDPPGNNTAETGHYVPEGAQGIAQYGDRAEDGGEPSEPEKAEASDFEHNAGTVNDRFGNKMNNPLFANFIKTDILPKRTHRHFEEYLKTIPLDDQLEDSIWYVKQMMQDRGVGKNWEYTLPIAFYHDDQNERFDTPWVIEGREEPNDSDATRFSWLVTAKALYRIASKPDTDLDIQQAHEFAAIYAEAGRLTRGGDMLVCPNVDWTREPVDFPALLQDSRNLLQQHVKAAWRKAFATAKEELGVKAEVELQASYKQMRLEKELDGLKWETPDKYLWEVRWRNARKLFESRGPAEADQLMFDSSLQRMWNDSQRSARYHSPPVMRPETSCSQYCSDLLTFHLECQRSCMEAYEAAIATAQAEVDEEEQDAIEASEAVDVEQADSKIRNGPSPAKALADLQEQHARLMVDVEHAGWGWYPEDEGLLRGSFNDLWHRHNYCLQRHGIDFERVLHLWNSMRGFNKPAFPPEWREGISAEDYVTNAIVPAVHNACLAQWDAEIIELRKSIEQGTDDQATRYETAKGEMERFVASLNIKAYGPGLLSFHLDWKAAMDVFAPDTISTDLKLRFQDIFEQAKRIYTEQDIHLKPHQIQDQQSEQDFLFELADVIDEQIKEQAENDEPEPDKPTRAKQLGFGGERSGQTGSWRFLGTAGQGAFGHAGIWGRTDALGTVVEKIVLKETYSAAAKGLAWDASWMWDGEPGTTPFEFSIIEKLGRLPDAHSIVRVRAFAIHDTLKMYRIYMEYCPHGTLNQLLVQHRAVKTGNLDADGMLVESNIPARALWAIFEALIAAIHLLHVGPLPGTHTGAFDAREVLHRDLKPENGTLPIDPMDAVALTTLVFLGAPNETGAWPGLPSIKLGDFGLSVSMDHDQAQVKGVGTIGFKAPETLVGSRARITTKSDVWVLGRIMVTLMNLDDTETIPDHGFDDIPEIPPFNPGVEDYYPLAMSAMVRRCLARLPDDRPSTGELWKQVQLQVATGKGLMGKAMRNLDEPPGEMLLFQPEKYLSLAAQGNKAKDVRNSNYVHPRMNTGFSSSIPIAEAARYLDMLPTGASRQSRRKAGAPPQFTARDDIQKLRPARKVRRAPAVPQPVPVAPQPAPVAPQPASQPAPQPAQVVPQPVAGVQEQGNEGDVDGDVDGGEDDDDIAIQTGAAEEGREGNVESHQPDEVQNRLEERRAGQPAAVGDNRVDEDRERTDAEHGSAAPADIAAQAKQGKRKDRSSEGTPNDYAPSPTKRIRSGSKSSGELNDSNEINQQAADQTPEQVQLTAHLADHRRQFESLGPQPNILGWYTDLIRLAREALKVTGDDLDFGPMTGTCAEYCAMLSNELYNIRRTADPKIYDAWDVESANLRDKSALKELQKRFDIMDSRVRAGKWPYGPDDPQARQDDQYFASAIGFDAVRAGQQPEEKWRQVSCVGAGAQATANLWECEDGAGNVVKRTVIKESRGDGWNNEVNWEGGFYNRFPKEAALTMYLGTLSDSFNIIKTFGYATYDTRRIFRIYMEWCPHGTLEVMLKKHSEKVGRLNEDGNLIEPEIPVRVVWSIFEGLITALCLMRHGANPLQNQNPNPRRLTHLDIKPANIFLSAPDEDFWKGIPVIKLGDFGVACDEVDAQKGLGTLPWQAPEQRGHTSDPYSPNLITTASDLWAVGRLIYCLMTLDEGDVLTEQNLDDEEEFPFMAEDIPDIYPDALIDLVESCLRNEAEKRPAVDELWTEIRKHTADPGQSVRGMPMNLRPSSADEMILFDSGEPKFDEVEVEAEDL